MARIAVGAFAFMAAATWLGVPVLHGLICLGVALVAGQAVRIYQRRNGAQTRASARRRERPRRPETAERPARSGLYDAEAAVW